MITLTISFFSSFFATLFLLRMKKLHSKYSLDNDFEGPQKFHKVPVPRIGGMCIFIGISIGILYRNFHQEILNNLSIYLLLSVVPTFIIGFLEDVTKKISVNVRLLFTFLSATIFIYLFNTRITNIDLPFIQFLLSIQFFSIFFTIFAITGLTNAYNIIDGFNGLASFIGIIALTSIAYVGLITGDILVLFLCVTMIGAIAGFFTWNYPNGNIFLGDGGAYLIGFWVACLSILIVTRQNSISPWFAFLVNAYPIVETIFTIYRRSIHKKRSAHRPDGIHLHTLIYRRIIKPYKFDKKVAHLNSRTAPYLWALSIAGTVPAIIWNNNTIYLILFSLFFIIIYIFIYISIVKFKIQKLLCNLLGKNYRFENTNL